jgi:hypothetical protein
MEIGRLRRARCGRFVRRVPSVGRCRATHRVVTYGTSGWSRRRGDIDTFILVALGAAVGIALVEAVVRRTDVGAGLLLGVFVLQSSDVRRWGFAVGPAQVGPTDLLLLVMLVAAVARLLRLDRSSLAHRLLLMLGALVVLSIFQGLGSYGTSAFNEARKFLVFVAVALYFGTAEPRQDLLDRIVWLWALTASTLCTFALARWLGNAVGITGGFFRTGDTLRVLNASEALLVAQAGLLTLPLLASRAGAVRYLAPGMFAFVVLLQHRSVWVVTAAGVVYLLYLDRSVTTRVLSVLVSALLVLSVLVFLVLPDQRSDVGEQLAASAQRTNTFEWRVEGWRALLRDSGPETASELLVGQPFGRGWDRQFDGITVDVSPHNFYLEAVLRLGLVGLVLLLLVYAFALHGTRPRGAAGPFRSPGLVSRAGLHVAVAVQLVFYIPYSPNASQALLVGLALSLATARTLTDDRAAKHPAGYRG